MENMNHCSGVRNPIRRKKVFMEEENWNAQVDHIIVQKPKQSTGISKTMLPKNQTYRGRKKQKAGWTPDKFYEQQQ